MIYEAEIIDGMVVRVVHSPEPGWAAANLGGTWEVCGDRVDPEVVPFVGHGYHFDPGVTEKFTGDVWSEEKATVPDSEGVYRYRVNGELTWHRDRAWRNLMPTGNPNVWEPGVANWREYPMGDQYPLWIQPVGAVDAYSMDSIVEHKSGVWRSTLDANVWEPGVYGWVVV